MLAGQSQATTFGMSAATLPPRIRSDDQMLIWQAVDWDGAGRWETYRPAVNSAPHGRWGPELELFAELRRLRPERPIALVKYAPGQTGAAAVATRLDWNIASHGEAWDRLVTMAQSASRSCGTNPGAIFWIGNHTDGLDVSSATTVGDNMRALILDSRARWGRTLPWIIGLPDDTAPYAALVRRRLAQLARTDPCIVIFDTKRYALQPDQLHYAADAVMQLGKDFYAAWRSISDRCVGPTAADVARLG